MSGDEKILELQTLHSRLIDSLCLELAVNNPDANSLSLLEILNWRHNNEITHEELIELYQNWLEAKNVFDICTARQIETYSKAAFIITEADKIPSTKQIVVHLEQLNSLYNHIWTKRKLKIQHELEAIYLAQKVFSYLDSAGQIHLRQNEVFFLTAALLIADNHTFPTTLEAFRVHWNDASRQLSVTHGLVSLRSFKNYVLAHPRRLQILPALLPILQDIDFCRILPQKGTSQSLPSTFEEAFQKWKNTPRFSTPQGKRQADLMKRMLEEYDFVLYQAGQTAKMSKFSQSYSQDLLFSFGVDEQVLKEFTSILYGVLQHYVDGFVQVGQFHSHKRITNLSSKGANQLLLTTPTHQSHQKQDSMAFLTIGSKTSIRTQKTPTKKSRTPRARNQETSPGLQRHFRSAEKSPARSGYSLHRTTTPTKESFKTKLKQKQVPLRNGGVFERMNFFRNKRVESYETVMKRLRGK